MITFHSFLHETKEVGVWHFISSSCLIAKYALVSIKVAGADRRTVDIADLSYYLRRRSDFIVHGRRLAAKSICRAVARYQRLKIHAICSQVLFKALPVLLLDWKRSLVVTLQFS